MPSKTIVEKARGLMERMPWLESSYEGAYRLLMKERYSSYKRQAQETLRSFGMEPTDALVQDMVRETLIHGTFYDEYVHYGFAEKSELERRTFLTDAVRNAICNKINDPQAQAMLMDKYRAYEHFGTWYGRKCIKAASEADKEAFVTLGTEMGQLVVKPISNCAGRGVEKLQMSGAEDWSQWFDQHVRKESPLMVEQLIVQAEEMGRWHPKSVNTIRTNTILRDGRFTLFSTFLRMGRSGSFMDNCGQGGLMASVDPVVGHVVTRGYDETGREYEEHPDSGCAFVGAAIPRWEELRALAETLARAIPELTFVAWDLALTKDGWVMVEGNKGQFQVQQTVLRRGIRKDFEKAVFGR